MSAVARAGTLTSAFDRCGAAVYGIALQVTGDPTVAADITAQVFAHGAEAAGGTCTQLQTAAHRLAVDHARRGAAEPAEATWPEPPALRGLPPAQAAAVRSVYFGARTHRDVAATLDIDPPAAATLLRDALRQVRSARS